MILYQIKRERDRHTERFQWRTGRQTDRDANNISKKKVGYSLQRDIDLDKMQ